MRPSKKSFNCHSEPREAGRRILTIRSFVGLTSSPLLRMTGRMTFLTISLLMIILSSFVAMSGCSKKENTYRAAKKSGTMSQKELFEMKKEVYSFRVEGFADNRKVQWGLEGESANVVLDKINITNLKAVYYGEDMTLTIFADKAIFDKKTQDIELLKNIVGKTSDGGELVADYAKWDAKTEKITTDSYVIVRRQNITCKGRGLVAKPHLKHVIFEREVEVDIAPDKKITCNGFFELNHAESVAIFNDNVKITDKDSETFTDKLTVYLDPETNKVLSVITEGSVRVVHRGNVENIGEMSF